MSTEGLPSRSEVMGWNTGTLADYLKRMRLVGCDKVVKKSNMTGARFLNMTDKDIKKFPTAHIPYITKICKDINHNNKQKKDLFHRSDHRMPPNRETNPGGWDSDEFDQEDSDNDYEEPDNNNCDDNYICATSDNTREEVISDDDYEPPPADLSSNTPSQFRVTKPLDGDYLDSGPRTQRQDKKSTPPPRGQMNLPKPPSRPDPSPHRGFSTANKSKPVPAVPMVDRSKKPGTSAVSKQDSGKSATNNPVKINNNFPMLPKPAALPTQKLHFQDMADFPPPPVQLNEMMGQNMDPRWYVGQITRGEAEVSLRHVNKDGSFLVRDSSKGCTEQPYTLMVLHQHKVYNIQIRYHGNSNGYSLGTGLNGIENFSNVMEMVEHHMGTPLILIDGLERGAGPQRQCCLMHPAGL